MLKPALRRSWRKADSLQFGVDPAHAVLLAPLDDPAVRFLALLDGTRSTARLTREAADTGLAPARVERLLSTLAGGGLLDDADSAIALTTVLRHRGAALDRLRPDLASLSVVHPRPGAAAHLMTARRAARIRVDGMGRVGASIASVLSAAGIGRVDVTDGGRVEPWDTAPGGIASAQAGERRAAAGRAAVRRAAPDAPPSSRSAGDAAEPPLALVVLAPRDGLAAYAPDPQHAGPLLAAGIPHLYAGVVEGMGLVGPLVLPGRSGCAGCLAAGRAESDAAWPRMLAQLRSGRSPGVPACDITLATLVAGLAAAHALAFLDGGSPPSIAGRAEFSLTGLALRTVRCDPHPACGCGAACDGAMGPAPTAGAAGATRERSVRAGTASLGVGVGGRGAPGLPSVAHPGGPTEAADGYGR